MQTFPFQKGEIYGRKERKQINFRTSREMLNYVNSKTPLR